MRVRALKLVILLVSMQGAALQAAPWYQVELIIFEYLNAQPDGELWHEDPGLPDGAAGLPLVLDNKAQQHTGTPTPYRALPRQDYQLAGVARALQLSRDYRLVLHIAWRQPALAGRSGWPVRVASALLSPPPAAGQNAAGAADEPAMIYDGIIGLRGARLLYVDVDVGFFPSRLAHEFAHTQPAMEQPQGAAPSNRQQAKNVRLTETRRIKLNEIHYFDHPLFGILLQVSRLQQADNDR